MTICMCACFQPYSLIYNYYICIYYGGHAPVYVELCGAQI